MGQGDSIDAAQGADFEVTGTDDSIAGSGATVALGADSSSDNVLASGDWIDPAPGDDLDVTGSNDAIGGSDDVVDLGPGTTGDYLAAQDDSITAPRATSSTSPARTTSSPARKMPSDWIGRYG